MPSDEMKMEDITPEDLGCMGEKEIDDGVMEDAVGAGPTKKPKESCFANVPFESRKLYRKFYDEFFTEAGRDLPFEEFAVQMCALSSPMLMQKDLGDITAQKHAGYQRKAAIDHRMRNQN